MRHRWVGRIVQRRSLGDHEGYVLEPTAVQVEGPYRQLDSTAVSDLSAGHPRQIG